MTKHVNEKTITLKDGTVFNSDRNAEFNYSITPEQKKEIEDLLSNEETHIVVWEKERVSGSPYFTLLYFDV